MSGGDKSSNSYVTKKTAEVTNKQKVKKVKSRRLKDEASLEQQQRENYLDFFHPFQIEGKKERKIILSYWMLKYLIGL